MHSSSALLPNVALLFALACVCRCAHVCMRAAMKRGRVDGGRGVGLQSLGTRLPMNCHRARANGGRRPCTQECAHTNMHIHTHVHTHACMHAHTHAPHTCTVSCTVLCTHARTPSQQPSPPPPPPPPPYTCARARVHAWACAHAYAAGRHCGLAMMNADVASWSAVAVVATMNAAPRLLHAVAMPSVRGPQMVL